MTAPNTLSLSAPKMASKTVREYVLAFALPLLAIASVLAAHAATASWTQAQAAGCPTAAHSASPAHAADACRQD